MHWTVILFLISVIISGIIAHLLHNSHYRDEDPVKLPLILWIVYVAITLIPVINCLACILYIIGICGAYYDKDIEFNEDFWLAKMY